MRFKKQSVGQKISSAREDFAGKRKGNARIAWPATVPKENQKVYRKHKGAPNPATALGSEAVERSAKKLFQTSS